MYRKVFKRAFDLAGAVVGLVLCLPVLLPATIVSVFAGGGNPFFLQPRAGLGGRTFTMIKLKTMNDKRDARGQLLPDSERIHRAGRFIRSTSIDELPQMINVLRGEMSFIGPRPLLVRYLPCYDEHQWRRHEVRPGMTGWAQVNGRNAISWEQRLDLDVWYVDNLSAGLDARIVGLTIRKIVLREGIDSDATTTMIPFDQWQELQNSKK